MAGLAATTPISELVDTIKLVRIIQQTLEGLSNVVERLDDRVVRLEEKTAGVLGSTNG